MMMMLLLNLKMLERCPWIHTRTTTSKMLQFNQICAKSCVILYNYAVRSTV